MALRYTTLNSGDAAFKDMIKRFGVVTVMNAKVYELPAGYKDSCKTKKADEIIKMLKALTPLCTLDTLKIANVTQEGPTKTITGGQYASPLLKYGKTARLEMQDALGNADAIEALCGGVREANDGTFTQVDALHFGQDFAPIVAIVGETFFINQSDGKQVPVEIIFYQFLPDSLFNLTQDAEGDATVFDMNGDLLCTDILMSTNYPDTTIHGAFYSIVNPALTTNVTEYFKLEETSTAGEYKVTIADNHTAEMDGATLASNDILVPDSECAALIRVFNGATEEVYRTVLMGYKPKPTEQSGGEG